MNDSPGPDLSGSVAAGVGPTGHFELTLLGTFRLTEDGRSVVLSGREQQVLALLAVRDRTMGRSALAGILWADSPDDHALGSLRTALSRLPRRLRKQVMITPHDLTLSSEVDVDLRRARLAAEQLLAPISVLPESNDSRPILVLLSSDLLPDWYEDWTVEESREWHSTRARALESWSGKLLASTTASGS